MQQLAKACRNSLGYRLYIVVKKIYLGYPKPNREFYRSY